MSQLRNRSTLNGLLLLEEEPDLIAAIDTLARGRFHCENDLYVIVVMTHTPSKWSVRVVAIIVPSIFR